LGQRPALSFSWNLILSLYVHWTTRFIMFHGKRHPRDLTNGKVGRFLGHVAQTHKAGGRGTGHALQLQFDGTDLFQHLDQPEGVVPPEGGPVTTDWPSIPVAAIPRPTLIA